jgi:hypothetical protein
MIFVAVCQIAETYDILDRLVSINCFEIACIETASFRALTYFVSEYILFTFSSQNGTKERAIFCSVQSKFRICI